MTRINADLNPKCLLDQHLMAEYRELPMVYAALRRSLRTKSINDIMRSIPKKFTLNAGHVTFFYDKLEFLENRYEALVLELIDRGYQIDLNRCYYIQEFPEIFRRNWTMQPGDYQTITDRLIEKFDMKPTWYKMHGKQITRQDFLIQLNSLNTGAQ